MFVSDLSKKAIISFFLNFYHLAKKSEIHTVISTVGKNLKDTSVAVYSKFPAQLEMTQFYDFFEGIKFISIFLQDLYNPDNWHLDSSLTAIIQYN